MGDELRHFFVIFVTSEFLSLYRAITYRVTIRHSLPLIVVG
jgi:hypothetical protein